MEYPDKEMLGERVLVGGGSVISIVGYIKV